MMRTPSSRGRLKRLAAVLLVTVLPVAGCSGAGVERSTAPTDKVLHLSFLQDPGQPPDPDVFYAGQGLLLTTNVYEGLLQYRAGTATATLEPLLATGWTESRDHTLFTFTLREGVTFHDGTQFTSAAVKASFDRRLAVDQGPAYMVTDVESVTTEGDFAVTVTLKAPNSAFLDYLASPYGPRMLSPTGLRMHAGSDNAQTYLTTHDLGTGPYTLATANVGSRYELARYPQYWGAEPYFDSVEIPVITDVTSQQLQFDSGKIAAILHDLPPPAVQSYRTNGRFVSYTLPTMMSNYLYVNPHRGMLTQQGTRAAALKAINVDQLVDRVYSGRGQRAGQIYPPNMIGGPFTPQTIEFDPSILRRIVDGLAADERSMTIGFNSSNPDNELISNLIQAQLAAAGLSATVRSYPTAEMFGWIGTDRDSAPDIFTALAWPDGASPYTWGHISFDPDGGLNFLGCASPAIGDALAEGLRTGAPRSFSRAGEAAMDTGCWMNIADVDDFVVAQPWLKGVQEGHTVTNPNSLRLAALSVHH